MFDEYQRRTVVRGIGGAAIGSVLGSGAASAADDSTEATADGRRRFGFSRRSTTIRACSFNVRYDNPSDEHSWDERLGRVTETVTEAEPDLLGVQEALANQYDDLRNRLEAYEWYGVGRDDGDREGEMVPVAWRADRFEMLDRGAFWLSETPAEPSVGWDADLPRVTTWASLRHRESGRRIWFCNTHFSHVSETARAESARLILERARERAADGMDVVAMGDFNAKPSRNPYRIMTGLNDDETSPLVDPRREADTATVAGPWGTYHGFTNRVGDRIDYVFTGDTATVNWYRTLPILEDAYRSDHLPVLTELEYGPRWGSGRKRRTGRRD
ncbi:endonuclease/exonuclease/phosphatase family protein [Haloterrigena sp. SYSU A558-1]|uniref:Endonuclease/exonuclease/phosphatase family protein n=1 Tax=Haloterrigena gelatinilytica TaxID=2741724 RepID=A0A8J8GPA3_9EURY|nr:endonuclease/exonuclease/phosphatase family protein [Haloterrigena gelatinilytica]NUC71235.1 endonuclease/exonuclease/phosphatase family protein [Haloterrigena gelatinilytica]